MSEHNDIRVRGQRGLHALALFISELPEELAWYTRHSLVSLNVKRKDNSWLMVVTAQKGQTKNVAFLEADTMLQLYRNLYKATYSNSLNWRKSRF